MLSQFTNYRKGLSETISAKGLGYFRFVFGLTLFFQSLYFSQTEFWGENIVNATIHFPFIDDLPAISSATLRIFNALMIVTSLLICIGKFFKLACILFLSIFTYLWLQEISIFNNHYYFISLIVFLLIFSGAENWNVFSTSKSKSIKVWQQDVFIWQLLVVFICAGLAKFNVDWLIDFQPILEMLKLKVKVGGPNFLAEKWFVGLLAWMALFFELSIVLLLIFKKTRVFGVVLFIGFNLFNFYIFYNTSEIGFFPIFLLSSLFLFYFRSTPKALEDKGLKKSKPKVVHVFLILFFIFQIILPARHIFSKHNPEWTGLNQRFSWRMKMLYKETDFTFYLVGKDEVKKSVRVDDFLTPNQYSTLHYYPQLIPTIARYLKKEFKKRGLENFKIVIDYNSGCNGREKQTLVKPDVDLTKVLFNSKSLDHWINEYEKN